MARQTLALVLLVTLVAGGCATGPREWLRNGLKVGPNYARPPAPVSERWIDADNPNLIPQATDYSYWWRVFNDPVLDELVCAAYQENLPLKIAGMRVLEARAQLGVATGNLLPQQQQMTGAYRRSEMSENSFPFGEFAMPKWAFDTWSVGFDAAWELDFWGRFRRMVESADANMNARIEDYDDALVILQAEVAATYVQMRTLEQRMELAGRNVGLQSRTVRITEDRFDKGMVSELDVQQARALLAATESLIPMLESHHRRTQNRLCTLLGMPPQDLRAVLGGQGKIPTAPPEVAVGIPAELLRRRPDVRRAEREAAAQCARIGIAEAEMYPQIAITGTISFEAEEFSDLLDWKSIAGGVGPGFRWNILNYGRIRNSVDVEDARFAQLVLKYQETVLRANEEAEGAVTAFLREQVRAKAVERGTEATTRAVELANIQYEQGLIDFQRVLDSQRGLVQQQDTLAQSYGDVALNLVAVYKALGGGWQMRCMAAPAPAQVPMQAPMENPVRAPTQAPPPEPTPASMPLEEGPSPADQSLTLLEPLPPAWGQDPFERR